MPPPRALKIYDRHTQANAMDSVDYVNEKFSFRIRKIRTDNSHEFQAKFHWHVEDMDVAGYQCCGQSATGGLHCLLQAVKDALRCLTIIMATTTISTPKREMPVWPGPWRSIWP